MRISPNGDFRLPATLCAPLGATSYFAGNSTAWPEASRASWVPWTIVFAVIEMRGASELTLIMYKVGQGI